MVVQCNASGIFAELNWDGNIRECVDLLYDFDFQCVNESGNITNGKFGESRLRPRSNYSNRDFMLQPGTMCTTSGQYIDEPGGYRYDLPEGTCTVGKKIIIANLSASGILVIKTSKYKKQRHC